MRTPITLKIKFKSGNLDQFIERYSVDVSRGGIFIRTKEPLAVGTQLKFEFQLQDASALIAGDGTVVWIREYDPARGGVAPGMGVRFDRLLPASQSVLEKILAEKQKRGEAQMESRFDAGVRASATASGTVSPKAPPRSDFAREDSKMHTPLPSPVPGMEEEGHDEFASESTRVMQNEVVQALADKTRGEAAARDAFDTDEVTRRASVEQLDAHVARTAEPSDKVQVAPEMSVEQKPAATPPVAAMPPAPPPGPPTAPPPSNARATELPPDVEQLSEIMPPMVTGLPLSTESRFLPGSAVTTPQPPRRSASSPLLWIALVIIGGAGGWVFFRPMHSPHQPAATQARPAQMVAAATPPSTATAPQTGIAGSQPKVAPGTPAELPPPNADVAKGAAVWVSSDPAGAVVTVDGKPTAQPAPVTLSGLDPTQVHALVLSMKGFHDWKINLKPTNGQRVLAAMVPTEKWLEVSSTPTGALVRLDGKVVGRTPVTVHKLNLSFSHQLELKRAGYQPATAAVTPSAELERHGNNVDVVKVALELQPVPRAQLTPRSHHPAEAVVLKKHARAKTATAAVEAPAEAAAQAEPQELPKAPPVPTPATANDAPAQPAEAPAPKEGAPAPAAPKPAAASKAAAAGTSAAKPVSEKQAIKVPTWMQKGASGSGGAAPSAAPSAK